jgi:NADH dehydrogenase
LFWSKRGPTILASFPPKLRDAAREALIRLNVEVREQTTVTGVDAHGVWLGQERLDAGTVLWAAGVAASPLLRTLGAPLDRAGRVLVERDLSIPGHPEVFVVGDAAAFTQDGQLLPGVAQVAMQGAAHAARTIMRRQRGEPSEVFVYRDLGNLAIIGAARRLLISAACTSRGRSRGCSGCSCTSSSSSAFATGSA